MSDVPLGAKAPHHLCNLDNGLLFSIHPVVHVGLHFEEFPETVVIKVEQFEKIGITGEDDLDIEWNRFRTNGSGAKNTVKLPQIFDSNFLITEGSL